MLKTMLKALTYTVTSHYGNSGYMYNNSYNTMSTGQAKALFGIVWGVVLIVIILAIIGAVGFYRLAKKMNHPNPWWAFIPILNVIQLLQLAELNPWLILLLFVPYVNFLLPLVAYYKISQKASVNMTTSLILAIFIPFYWPYYVLKNIKTTV